MSDDRTHIVTWVNLRTGDTGQLPEPLSADAAATTADELNEQFSHIHHAAVDVSAADLRESENAE